MEKIIERLFLHEGLFYPFARVWDKISFHLFYKYYYRSIFSSYGQNVRWGKNLWRQVIPKSVRISCPEKITIGDDCQFDEGVFLQCHKSGDGIVIGNGTRINCHSHLLAFDKIELESKVLVAPFCLIVSGNHGNKDNEIPIMDQPHQASGPVVIGMGTWLGQNSKVLGGVHLGRNCLVAAGAVVTKSFGTQVQLGGIPAKEIGRVGK